jgi:hypothetical protein
MLRGKPTQFVARSSKKAGHSHFASCQLPDTANRQVGIQPPSAGLPPQNRQILIEDNEYIKWQDLLGDANSVGNLNSGPAANVCDAQSSRFCRFMSSRVMEN